MDLVDCLVIGAGVIGLAIADDDRLRHAQQIIVVEAENGLGAGVSSRNSEVIHAGIYYPTGLTKTHLCVEGKAMLYRFCSEYGVPHRRWGETVAVVPSGVSGSSF